MKDYLYCFAKSTWLILLIIWKKTFFSSSDFLHSNWLIFSIANSLIVNPSAGPRKSVVITRFIIWISLEGYSVTTPGALARQRKGRDLVYSRETDKSRHLTVLHPSPIIFSVRIKEHLRLSLSASCSRVFLSNFDGAPRTLHPFFS